MTTLAILAFSGEPAQHTGESPDVGALVRAGVGLIAIASAVGVVTKFVRIPYTVALVVAGLALALVKTPLSGNHMTEEMVMVLFLPPLLFQAGLHLDLGDLRRHWLAVLLMAVPGVALSTALSAVAIHFVLPYAVPPEHANWTTAFMLGAILAPTDPISVISTFRSLGVPNRLRVIVEGESLFNDGTGAALFAVLKGGVIAIAAAHAAGDASAADVPGLGQIAVEFLRETAIGTVVGLGLGYLTYLILCRLNDHTLETGITIALAWGSYVAAVALHASGVISVVVAGLLIGNQGKARAMSDETRTTLTGFWDSIDFVINSVVFLLVGLELSSPDIGGVSHLTDTPVLLGAGAVYGAMLIARAIKVFAIATTARDPWPRSWNPVIWWAGLRGGLCLALALGLPHGPLRAYVLTVVFLVVLATLILQGTTMPMLIRRAGIGGNAPAH